MNHPVQTMVTRRWVHSLVAGAVIALGLRWNPPSVAAQADAGAILQEAAAKMSTVGGFHFELSTPRGETRFASEFTLLSLSGDVQRPDRFRAVALVDAVVARLELTVIGIGTSIWVTDPLSPDGGFREIDLAGGGDPAGGSFADLINPDRLFLSAVETIQDPVIAGQEEVDGVATTRINGTATLVPRALDGLVGTPIAGTSLTDQPLQVAIWIDDQRLVRQLDIYGPLLTGEAANTVRRLSLSMFDEPLDIQPPTPEAG